MPTAAGRQRHASGTATVDGEVSIDEIVVVVGIGFGTAPASACPACDPNSDGRVTVEEIVIAVQSALGDCRRTGPTATTMPIGSTILGMSTLIKSDEVIYCIGSRTGILVRAAPPHNRGLAFDQDRAGLHHLCFRARSREDIDAIYRFVVDELDAGVVHPPEDGSQFAPGYYSVLFEDPDGLRVEVNHVPGKGHLGPGGRLGPGGPGPADRYGSGGLTNSE